MLIQKKNIMKKNKINQKGLRKMATQEKVKTRVEKKSEEKENKQKYLFFYKQRLNMLYFEW